MTLNQMKYFIAICNEKSFSKAAELLYVTQPAISRQIIALEEELGFPLIKRTKGKGFEITAIGKQYYNLFSRFISEKSYMEYLVQNFDIVPDKIYTVGLMDGWELHEWIESCNLKIKSLFSNVQLSFKFYPPDSLDDVLQKNQLDFAIFPDSLYKKYYSYEKYFLLKINSVFFVSSKNKAVINGKIDKSLITGPLYCNGQMEQERINTFSHEDISSQKRLVFHEQTTLFSICQNVLAGSGVGLCDSWSFPAFSDEFASDIVNNISIPIIMLHKLNADDEFLQIKKILIDMLLSWNERL